VPVGLRYGGAWQHTGLGHKLLSEAEALAEERGAARILVLSALGTKGYYRRAGYDYVGPYMGKMLN
jgi:elongator complex protein 3